MVQIDGPSSRYPTSIKKDERPKKRANGRKRSDENERKREKLLRRQKEIGVEIAVFANDPASFFISSSEGDRWNSSNSAIRDQIPIPRSISLSPSLALPIGRWDIYYPTDFCHISWFRTDLARVNFQGQNDEGPKGQTWWAQACCGSRSHRVFEGPH